MSPKEDLYQLISSMTPAEKGYFRKYAQAISAIDDTDYLVLFNTVVDLQEPSENAVRQSIPNKRIVKRLSAVKNYLYTMILRAMRSYHAGTSAERLISELFTDADFLWEKKLYGQALKLVEKALRLAEDSEEFALAIKAVSWMKNAALHRVFSHEADVDRYYALHKDLAIRLQNALEYEALSRTISQLTLGAELVWDQRKRTEFIELFQRPLLASAGSALSLQSKLNFHHAWARYHELITCDAVATFEHRRERLNLIEAKPAIIQEKFDVYCSVLQAFLQSCLSVKRYEEFESRIEYLSDIAWGDNPHFTENTRFKARFREIGLLQNFCGETRQIERYLPLLARHSRFLVESDGLLSPDVVSVLACNLGYYLFASNRYLDSLPWLNKAFLSSKNLRPDVAGVAQLLSLIAYLEIGELDSLPYVARSARRFLIAQRALTRRESAFFRFLSNCADRPDAKSMRLHLEKLSRAFEEATEEPIDLVTVSDIPLWLEAKIAGTSFLEIVRTKRQSRQT